MQNPKVFVTQWDESRDYSKAARFGELVPLCSTKDEIWPDRMLESSGQMADAIEKSLTVNDFRPERDFILLSGDPVAIAMTSMFIEEMFQDRTMAISFLKYSNQLKDYFVVEI